MKKRWLLVLAVISLFCLMFALCGCGEEHTAHEFGEWTVLTAPTCSEDGKKERVCACGEREEQPIPALGHAMTKHDGVPASCTEAGTKEYWSCDRCHKNFADEQGTSEAGELTIQKLGHNMTEHKRVEPTCTEEGTKEYWSCDRCHKNFADEQGTSEAGELTIQKLGHNMTEHKRVEPTCTEEGQIAYFSCDRCHKNFADEQGTSEAGELTIQKLGHNMTEHKRVEPTCTEAGQEAYFSCDRCHKNFADGQGTSEAGELTIQKLDHTPEEYIEQQPSCDVPGKKYHRCSVCHTSLSGEEEIPALGHDWGDWIFNRDATCTENGTETRECKRENCEASETHEKKESALGHDYDKNGICRRCYNSCEPKTDAPVLDGDGKVEFGSYPQTEVKDAATTAALISQAGALPTAQNAGGWTSYGYYRAGEIQNYMWYIDLWQSGSRYRGVYFTQYRTGLAEDEGGRTQKTNGYITETVYWFRYEPIVWRVLTEEGGVSLLLADLMLDSQQYYHDQSVTREDGGQTVYPNNYAESDIRAWLNGTFFETAFTAYQQDLVQTTLVDNSAATMQSASERFACASTLDKVFLLSYREAAVYYGMNDADRRMQSTDYAKAQGLNVSLSGQNPGGSWWWLRSPYNIKTERFVSAVGADGHVKNYMSSVGITSGGVVPAIRLSLTAQREEGPDRITEKKVVFGSYPQTRVTEKTLTEALEGRTGALPTAEDAGDWTDYGYYYNGEVASYMWYIDVLLNGEKYRGVYFTQYRPYDTTVTVDEKLVRTNQDDNGYTPNAVYWFRFEPITWRILEQKDGTALLLADFVLDGQQYYHEKNGTREKDGSTIHPNNYAESDIRAWLNTTFYETAFTGYQQSFLESCLVDNSAATTTNAECKYICENTQDSLFLLAYCDVTNVGYGFISERKITPKRMLKASDYAQCQGVYVGTKGSEGYASWWTRTPGNAYNDYAFCVQYNGYAYLNNIVTLSSRGVVPAMRIKLAGESEEEGSPVVREDGKVEFGSYPQTRVTDENVVKTLEGRTGALPTAENAGDWTDYGYYDSGEVASYMWYIDVFANGEKYRGVYFTHYRPSLTTDEGRIPNSYQDDYHYSEGNIYWFKFEPIVWRILTEKQGASLLMADLVLDAQDYYYELATRQKGNETIYANNYVESHIRAWLNETFYQTAFNSYQQSLIEVTAVGCPGSESDPNGFTWDVVQDKIFLLSQEEALNESYGFVSGASKKDEAKMLKSTDYAKVQNVYKTGEFGYTEYTRWWLRTPASDLQKAMAVTYQGKANLSANCTYVYGVVPALYIRLG